MPRGSDHSAGSDNRDLWPAVVVALTHDVSNVRTEGFNRVIKETNRVACGYRSMANCQRRILSHIAVTRSQGSAAWTGTDPLRFRSALFG